MQSIKNLVAQLYIFLVNLIGFPIWALSMYTEPAKLADFSKMCPVHLRQFCKIHSIYVMHSIVCAEVTANMAETTKEKGLDRRLPFTYC